MKKAWVEDNSIKLRFGGDDFKLTLSLIKEIEGRRFDGNTKTWTLPNNHENIRILHDAGFALTADLAIEVAEEIDESWLDVQATLPTLNKGFGFYEFQKLSLKYLSHHGYRGVFGLPMGTGKTLLALSYIKMIQAETEDALPALVICPSPVKFGFRDDYKKFFGSSVDTDDIVILEGMDSIAKYKHNKIYVINYELLSRSIDKHEVQYVDRFKQKRTRVVRSPSPALARFKQTGFRCVIADEVHRLKNEESNAFLAFKFLVDDVQHILGMSGTPILSRPIELWSYWHILKPSMWKKTQFINRYCEPYMQPIGKGRKVLMAKGATNLLELNRRLRNNGMLIMDKRTILPDLPDKPINTVLPIEMDKYDEYLSDRARVVAEISEDRRLALTLFEKLKQSAVKHKMSHVFEFIEEALQNEEKLVIFAEHQDVVDRVHKKFPNSVIFNGTVSSAQKYKNKQKFVEDPECKLMIGNTQSLGQGVDGLQKSGACTIIFLELPWNPSDLDQAIARLWRDGFKGEKGISVHFLVGSGTIEEEIMDLLDSKRGVTEAIIRGEDADEGDLLTILRDRYLDERKVV